MAGRRYRREVGSDEERLHEDLLERAQRAVDAATEILATSQVLTTLSVDRRHGTLTSRCAWCGRYRIEGTWVKVGPGVAINGAETTHGICEDCVAALRGAGLSV